MVLGVSNCLLTRRSWVRIPLDHVLFEAKSGIAKKSSTGAREKSITREKLKLVFKTGVAGGRDPKACEEMETFKGCDLRPKEPQISIINQ